MKNSDLRKLKHVSCANNSEDKALYYLRYDVAIATSMTKNYHPMCLRYSKTEHIYYFYDLREFIQDKLDKKVLTQQDAEDFINIHEYAALVEAYSTQYLSFIRAQNIINETTVLLNKFNEKLAQDLLITQIRKM